MGLTKLKTGAIADDAVTTDKLANAINTERTANTAKVSLEDNAVTLAKMAGGTDGQIITYDASGDPVAVGPGTDGQVLTSTGAGSPPAFETPAPGVGGATGVDFNDDVKARWGTGNDFEIWHSSNNNTYLKNSTGELKLASDNIALMTTDQSEKFIDCNGNGNVELYYDNVKKLETTAGGATVHCTDASDGFIVQGDLRFRKESGTTTYIKWDGSDEQLEVFSNVKVSFGSSDNAFIKHTGSDLFIENDTGGMNIKCTSGTGVGEGVITFSGGTGTEYMRMTTYGDLNIGYTATDTRFGIKQRSTAVDFMHCKDASDNLKFYIHSSGNLYNTNNSYNQISDQSLKENIVDAKSQWNDIKNIKIRNFNFTKASGYDTHTQIGCVAQEVETVSPKLVTAPREDGIKTVATSVLYMKAIKALQEAITKIETLETKVAALEAK